MKFLSILALSALMLIGCATSNELPPISQIKPSVSEEGSLANEKLVGDTIAGLGQFADVASDTRAIALRCLHDSGQIATFSVFCLNLYFL